MKLNKTEQRAKNYCEAIEEQIKNNGEFILVVQWNKSREWGSNPQIKNWRNERLCNVSGCGYCKLSTALANVLCFLACNEIDNNAIWRKGGTGDSSVIEEIEKYTPYTMKKVQWADGLDIYKITLQVIS